MLYLELLSRNENAGGLARRQHLSTGGKAHRSSVVVDFNRVGEVYRERPGVCEGRGERLVVEAYDVADVHTERVLQGIGGDPRNRRRRAGEWQLADCARTERRYFHQGARRNEQDRRLAPA